jgi:hypothetical protein
MTLKLRVVSVLTVAMLALAGLAASASAAPTLVPGRTVPMSEPSIYTLAGDGTFWVVRSTPGEHGEAFHFGPAGEVPGETLGEFPITMNRFNPKSIGFYGGRVLIASSGTFENQLYTWPATSIGTSAPVEADEETELHWGSDQFAFRINSAGTILAAFGDNNKIGLFNANTASGEHPYYETSVMGAGINGHYVKGATPFESCESRSGIVSGEPKRCGDEIGEEPGLEWGPEGFAYPDDIADGGSGGLYVAEYFGYKSGASITRVGVGGGEGFPRIEFRFGPPGSGEGDIIRPLSIVRDPSTGWLYVSEEGNRRIDVFDSGGGFLGAFGYGVHDGADTFEACGGAAGSCQAAVPFSADPRSLFTRLDLGPEGDLYAFEPKANQVQVFSLGGSVGGGEPGGGGGGGAGSTETGLTPINTPIAPPPIIKPLPKPLPKTLTCKKGFAKKKVKGVTKCVKKPAHHKKHSHHHKSHHP